MKLPDENRWETSIVLAELAGITRQGAHKILRKARWRGHQLVVRRVRGRGGKSGWQYQVRLDSLPLELQERWRLTNPGFDEAANVLHFPVPASALSQHLPLAVSDSRPPSSDKEYDRRFTAIQTALQYPENSPERGAAIRITASIYGVSESTVRSWITGYETGGLSGLCRKVRADNGNKRVTITRTWDNAIHADEDVKLEIAAKLQRYIRSLWAAGATGWRDISLMAGTKLFELTRPHCHEMPEAKLRTLCKVPRHLVEDARHYKIVALKDKDAKGYFDKALPRTRRSRDGMAPMDLVVADVHHIDILFQRSDGSTCTPKAICWLDLATNRLYSTLVFLEPGQGVRQEHVVDSFIDMCLDPEWGVPRGLYLDNGGEFKKLGFVDDAMRLASLPGASGLNIGFYESGRGRRSLIINAQAYNAPAKPIEGIFAVIESGPLAMIPGWIGGNRMKAKTHNVGKAPKPFDGSAEDFSQAFKTAMDWYHIKPQSGTLKGKSPREALSAFICVGWKRIDVDRHALEAIFASEITRTVRQGEVSIDGTMYRHDRLLSLMPDTRVFIRIPVVGDKSRVAVLDENGEFLCHAEPSPVWGFLDPEGAKDKGQRRKAQGKAISIIRADTDRIDLVAEMARTAGHHALAQSPESGGLIRLSEQAEAIGEAQKKLKAPAKKNAQEEQDAAQRAQYEAIQKLRDAG